MKPKLFRNLSADPRFAIVYVYLAIGCQEGMLLVSSAEYMSLTWMDR